MSPRRVDDGVCSGGFRGGPAAAEDSAIAAPWLAARLAAARRDVSCRNLRRDGCITFSFRASCDKLAHSIKRSEVLMQHPCRGLRRAATPKRQRTHHRGGDQEAGGWLRNRRNTTGTGAVDELNALNVVSELDRNVGGRQLGRVQSAVAVKDPIHICGRDVAVIQADDVANLVNSCA